MSQSIKWKQCRIEAVDNIKNKVEVEGSIRKALKSVSEESGIPIGTLTNWLYPEQKKNRDNKYREKAFAETANTPLISNSIFGGLSETEISEIKQDAVKQIKSQVNEIKKEKKEQELSTATESIKKEYKHTKIPCVVFNKSFEDFDTECDLLITDPPYSTDIEDINEFAKWLPKKLESVKSTGSAYIFVGAYPEELSAYLNVAMPTQVLVWTYRNTLGKSPLNKYKLNWQAILYYRMPDAPELNCPITNELWAVQDVNAPDGRLGNRYHMWQKPIELAERLIRHSTKKDDTVVDCFSGTGTFLLAAANLGRVGIGCEKDMKMIDIAVKRGVTYVESD